MKTYGLIRVLAYQFIVQCVLAANIRALYLFKDVMKSNTTAIKASGVNSVIIFGIGILADGGIMYYSNTPGSNDTLVASKGSYVGGAALSEKVRSLKINNTNIDRIEVSTNSAHIKDLITNPGNGTDTPLAKNFKALKEAWSLDAVNNDDESIYDLASTVSFAKMMGNIGLKYTIVPYTNPTYWNNLRSQLNSGLKEGSYLLDRVYLQCYDGGAGNSPASWQKTLGMKVVPLIWVTNDSKPSYGTTAAQAKTRFSGWNSGSALAGGGYWNDYDIEKMKLSYKDYGDVLKSVFP